MTLQRKQQLLKQVVASPQCEKIELKKIKKEKSKVSFANCNLKFFREIICKIRFFLHLEFFVNLQLELDSVQMHTGLLC